MIRGMLAATCVLALCAAPGCFTYSSYQSARIAEKGEERATLAVSRSAVVEKKPSEATWFAIEGGVRFGLARRVDAALLLSVFSGVPQDWGAAVVTADVRVGILQNYLTAVLPASIAMGDFYLATFRVQPGAVVTVPVTDRIEINGAVRAHIFVRYTDLFAMGYNVGLGLASESGTWIIRPEAGLMRFTGPAKGTTYAQFGIGVEMKGWRLIPKKE
jgi:hypothetical protein